MNPNSFKKLFKWVGVALLWLTVWQITANAVGQEILIPSPLAALSALGSLVKTSDFWRAVLYSMLRIITGYLAGVAVGVVGAVISSRFSVFRAIFSPVLHLVRAVPVASFIILAFVWIESPVLPAFISFLMVLPMIWSNVESGINAIDGKYLEMARVFRISSVKTLFEIKIPFIMPSFISAATTALGFAWKSGIAAEVICKPQNSLGSMLQDSKLYLDTPGVFAVTAVVALLSLMLEIAVKRLAGRYNDVKR